MTKTELFLFVQGNVMWTWTNGDRPITHNGDTYQPYPIARGEFEQSSDINRANVTLRVPRTNPIGLKNLSYGTDSTTSLTIFSVNGSDINVQWKGRVGGTKCAGSEIVIECESVLTSSRRMGLRARYQRNCRHAVYHRGCGLNREDWAALGVCTAVSGQTITVPVAALQPADWYLGGMVEYEGVIRFIAGHAGAQLVLVRPFDTLAQDVQDSGYGESYGNHYGGAAVKIYPGCDRTTVTCKNKFNNLDRHGGFSWLPRRNPFDGTSIV